ncbi:MAG: mechanosensitive ion channel [Spirochaetales bacterium]|jgi:small conductance mechanosensitive channel|nr:mechanosensitive ion channel [Spirochaetales bacterium]
MHEVLADFWRSHSAAIFMVGRRTVTALAIMLAGKILIGLSERAARKAAAGDIPVDETFLSILRLAVRYGTIIIAGIMILDVLGINTGSLIAVLGAAGIAVGIALKDTLGNIAAGIILLLLRLYKQGDYIEAGSVAGSVREFNLFVTVLETPEGIYIAAPNASIWGTPIKNYSRNGRRRMEIDVSIAYSDSIETAFRVMQEIIDTESRFLKDPAPQMMVKSLGDNGVNLMLRAWAESGNYWNVYWEQSRNIKEKIEAAGLSIPFPQRDIHILR